MDARYALSTARELAVRARYRRRRGRRYLWARFGVRVSSSEADTAVTYAALRSRSEPAPKDAGARMLRAEAVIEHAEWETVWRAVGRCRQFALADQGRMACKFACEAMRQAPALWASFVGTEPDNEVRKRALAELTGWLDTETRVFGRTREAVGDSGEKLRELAAVAMEAWDDLRPGEPLYLPNTFVKSIGQRRKKGSLAGRAGGLLDGLPALRGLAPDGETGEWFYGASDDELRAFVDAESDRRDLSAIIEKAGLSRRQAQVIERDRRGEENAQIAAALGIKESAVYAHRHEAIKKLRKAAGQ